MKATKTKAGGAVSRLGAIGNHEWWHCRTCGDVWQTTTPDRLSGLSHGATEARLHLATHVEPQHAGRHLWHREAAFRPMSEKQR